MLNFYGEYVRVNRHITTKLNQMNKKNGGKLRQRFDRKEKLIDFTVY